MIHLKISDHLTLSGAKERISKLYKDLSTTTPLRPSMLGFDDLLGFNFRISYKVKNGEDAKNNPDNYFLPGDHVQVKRSAGYHHAAIYIGNRRVIQVSPKQRKLLPFQLICLLYN